MTRINRYIMECKSNNFVDNVITVIELIDTLWNVNLIYAFSCIPQHSELIDTLWNVNYVFSDATLFGAGN